jgi:hypothetical protein
MSWFTVITLLGLEYNLLVFIIEPSAKMIRDIVRFCQDFKRAWISRLLKEKGGGSSFGPKNGNLRRTRKNLEELTEFHSFRVNKKFSHKF